MSDHPPGPAFNDEELSAEEVRQLRRKKFVRRLLTLGVPALVLVVVAVALAVPRIKDWRARQFATQAFLLRQEGKLQEAFNNAAAAVQLRPGLPEARRAYAGMLLAGGQSEGLGVFNQLVADGFATTEDRLELAEAALRFNDAATAEREALYLLQQGQNTPRALFILARVRLMQQKLPDALQALRESIESGGGPDPSILLARLQMAANTQESINAALDLLRPLARQQDKAGLEALMVLVASPALKTAEGPGWVAALRSHPEAGDEQKLAAASAAIQLRPAQYAGIVRRTMDEYRDGPVETRAQLARWLNQNREYDGTLEVISAGEAALRSDLFLIRLDAMAGRGDWAGIAEVLKGENIPLHSSVVLLYRGRAARETGETDFSASLYRRAVIEAARTPDIMWYVINYLQRVGEDRVLEQELLRLTDNPATARQALQALVPIVQKRQDAGELFGLYERMLRLLPAEAAVQNDHRYFAALTGRRADVSGGRELVDRHPRMLAYRITLALAHLKNGQPEAAMKVFDGITLDPAQIQPYQRAVLAAVLGANGRADEARQLARSVPADAVTVQELELVKPWRQEE